MSSPIVSVVVVNWNGLKFLDRCLRSLVNQTYQDFEIIMVDNGSTDGSVRFVKENYRQIRLLENKGNIGFAAANNQGINEAMGRYIALLNNDTEADKDWLKNLVKTADSSPSGVGMWACKILSMQDPSVIDSAGGLLISRCGIAKGRGRNEKDRNQYDGDREVLMPSACASMYRKEMLNDTGFFDDAFFAYCEDTDLGLRGRLFGWKTYSAPDAVVYHYYSGTTGRYTPVKAYLVERNHIWVALKNFPLSMLLFFPFLTIWRYLLQVYAVLTKKGAGGRYAEEFSRISLLKALLKAYLDAVKRTPEMLKKRRFIQAKKVVSKMEFDACFKRYGIKISEIVFKE